MQAYKVFAFLIIQRLFTKMNHDSYKNARVDMLSSVFAMCTCCKVHFLMLRLVININIIGMGNLYRKAEVSKYLGLGQVVQN